jgi:hypothetical protein
MQMRQQLCESSGHLGRVALSGSRRQALMGVSGNDMATLEGNPQGHACDVRGLPTDPVG